MTFASITSYDSQPSSDLFRKKYYGVIYQHAFRVTGADQPAKKLTERVFQELERRYASSPLTGHIDAYLAAQVYLSYAQKGLGDSDDGMENDSLIPEAEKARHISNPPEAAPTAKVSRVTEYPASIKENPAKADNRADTAPAPQAAKASAPAPKEEPRASAPRGGLAEPMPVIASSPRDREYYDRNSTIYWTPGMETEVSSPEEEPEDSMDFEFPKQPVRRHSALFSILNGLLALCCIGAIVFLLIELEIIPPLF